MLDPTHFGGGNSSYEGLALGIPIVTLPSEFLKDRITYALYKKIGLNDCIVSSREDYVRLGSNSGPIPHAAKPWAKKSWLTAACCSKTTRPFGS